MADVKVVEFERIYDAPMEKIWQAWTDPEQLKKWWGPDNVIIPECAIDLRVGGRIYIVMEATEGMGEYKGARWPLEGKFTTVEPNSKLSYEAKSWTEGDEEGSTIENTQEIIFTEENGKIKMNLKATLHKVGPKASMAVEGMKWGYNQQFDKLSQFLAK